jgi:hypothetical protein
MLEPESRSTTNESSMINHLRLGLNRWLQIFITQSFYMFLVRPMSNGSSNDEYGQLAASVANINTYEQNLREKSLSSLVCFYKRLPQRHYLDRSTW